jgi:tRNA pseudouridine38-40 synthase
MPRIALLIEYDGSAFHGWQRQAGLATVQQAIEEAAAPLNGGAPATTFVAGRTDAGVHAEGQVADITLSADLPPERVREALNFHTRPLPVAIRAAAPAPEGWSPRFSALRRQYRYRILNRSARPALDAGRVWHIQRPLAVDMMHAAAQTLLGRHDFSAFRAASCQAKDALRTLDRLDVSREAEEVVITAEARSFLHPQVRNLVGTLAEVGLGKRPETWPRKVLDGRDRTRAGQTAPAAGLCFVRVEYAEALDWG